MNRIVRTILIICGTVSVALAVIGIFVPILPTTPFLLLAGVCYARSSHRFHRWLLTNRWFGEYLRNYREGRGMPLREKVVTLAALWLTVGFSVLVVVPVWWGRLLLLAIALGVTVHLLRIRTYRPETRRTQTDEAPSPENGA